MKRKTIFIFAYYSFKDPVFQSAVLPYFQDTSKEANLRFILLTFEQQKYKMPAEKVKAVRKELAESQIIWRKTNWHSGRFKIAKKLFDFIWGITFSVFLIIRYKPSAIYSEGFPGAVIGHHLAKLFNIPHLVHTFEPHTEYMVESGVWSANSWEAKLLKKYEKVVAHGASYIFTATNAMIEKLKTLNLKAKVFRVPSCVDTSLFKYCSSDRDLIRRQFQIKKDECVITYLGKFGGMYMDEEIFDFMKICESSENIDFKFFIITPDDHESVLRMINSRKLQATNFFIKTLSRNEISKYLSASDFGLVPVRQNPSKRFCSPIKDGEYWACGLPIIIPTGISDDYLFAEEYKIGIVIEDMTELSMNIVVQKIRVWLKQNRKEDVVKRCNQFVESDRSIENYKKLYKRIFSEV